MFYNARQEGEKRKTEEILGKCEIGLQFSTRWLFCLLRDYDLRVRTFQNAYEAVRKRRT